ncbi:hypothetical protein CWB73_06905 [Pseudoalteromonas phenolica]|uniref:Elp3/MiaA/NifB-like radical SAM core domain-containing protein n=1 Tax=Pseudoalteromonas phenolica TaxID=161398 RepID=A0A5S3YWX0_9GAMM|nr:hypothetical protein [Pseudoalteromonas phenolica]TMP81612.1 hypothetical protein CWB73_06905 [Pseudoalteromonas phenolica]
MTLNIQGFPYDYELKTQFSPVYQKQLKQCTVIVPGGGCVYYRAHKGDVCPFCAFPAFSRYVIKGEGHEDYFGRWTLDKNIYQEMYLKSIESVGLFDKLAIFNGGSFFPDSELPNDFQHFVYNDVAKRSHIRQLMVEVYPSFISERKLVEAKTMLGDTDLMIGVGFESHDDQVRNSMLRKRINKDLFEEKVRLMQKLGIQVFIYAFLKAPELTEKQAIDETLTTLQYLHNLGVDEIALSCAFVPPGTNLETLYNKGEFRPPWLWSILKILEVARQKGWPLSIGEFEDTPPPVAIPNNCNNCDSDINTLIDHHRLNGFIPQNHQIACDCKSIWDREIGSSKLIIPTREY